MRKQHIATKLSECFCLWLLAWNKQLIHPFLIGVIVILSQIFWPIHEVSFRNEFCQLTFMSVIFLATKVLYSISRLGSLAISQCLTHFLDTFPGFFIDGHNIKGKWYHRRHLYYNFEPRRSHCCSVHRCRPKMGCLKSFLCQKIKLQNRACIFGFCLKSSQRWIKDFKIMV